MFSPSFMTAASRALQPRPSGTSQGTMEVELRFKSYNPLIRPGLPRDIFYRLLDNLKNRAQLVPTYIRDSIKSTPGQGSLRLQESKTAQGTLQRSYQRKQNFYREKITNYPVLASVNQESPVNQSTFTNFVPNLIRQKTRYSALIQGFRLDMTIVVEYKLVKGAWKEEQTTYEVEIEVLHLQQLQYLESITKLILKYIWQSNLDYTIDEYQKVVTFYNKVLSLQPGTTVTREDLRRNGESRYFSSKVLYKPRNLKFPDLVYGGIVGNKINNYVVSYKADGERKILVVDSTGLWLVAPENDANLISRNIPSGYQGLILEGEYILSDKHKGQLDRSYEYIYYLYDILSKPLDSGIKFGIDVQGLPYLSRIAAAQDIVRSLRGDVQEIFIGTKRHLLINSVQSFFNANQKLLLVPLPMKPMV